MEGGFCLRCPLITFGTDGNGNKTITAGRLENTKEARILTVKAALPTDEDDICARCQVTIVPRQYTVRFFGFNRKLKKTEKVYRNQSATPPSDEVMSAAAPKGYHFNGWEVPDSWKNIVEDKDVYAKEYVQTIYTIDYILGAGGTNAPENPTSYKVTDKTVALQDAIPAPSKKFAGWYLDQAYTDSPIAEIPSGSTGNFTLYAKWISDRTGLRIEPIGDQPYTGKALTPTVKVYDGETLLTLGTDYTVSYKNNTNAYLQNAGMDARKMPTVTVKGKGNYEKSDTESFQIVPQSIAAGTPEIVIPDLYLAYTGRKLTVTPTVMWNGKKLVHKKDFEVTKIADKDQATVAECIAEGVYTVTVSGKGNFTGERNISLTVTKKTLLSKVSFKPGKLKDIPWTALQGKTLGEAGILVDEGILLKKGSDELQKGTDYTVTFDTNIKEAGTYEAVFTGTGTNYVGTVTKTFNVTGKPLSANKLEIQGLTDLCFNGTKQTPTLTVYYKEGSNKSLLTPDTDYTFAFDNTKNAGNKAAVVITGINGYTGTVKKTFKIAPYSLKDATAATLITTSLTNNSDSVAYEKGGAKPKVIVKYGETVLRRKRLYGKLQEQYKACNKRGHESAFLHNKGKR